MKLRPAHLKKFEANELGHLFVMKIINAKPPSVELTSWVELIFGLHERFIIQYECIGEFTMPGLFKPTAHIRISGTKRQIIKKEKRLWVRIDKKYPNVIDVEAPVGHAEEPRIFQLTEMEWLKIRKNLKPVTEGDLMLHQRTFG